MLWLWNRVQASLVLGQGIKGNERQVESELFLQSTFCHYHPTMTAVGSCPRCRNVVCAACLPSQGKPCRTCIGYRWAFTSGGTGAVMVSFILAMYNPLIGVAALVTLFFTFRALFRYRTRVMLGKLVESSTSVYRTPIETTARRFCTTCNLWNDGPTCVQCGNKIN